MEALPESSLIRAEQRATQHNALIAGFLGWTLDAFDFFVLTFVVAQVAHDFGVSVPAVALTIAASLWTRPIGAIVFGLMADRWGRRLPLMINILFYSAVAFLCGFAPNYTVFFGLRLLYGIGMGGEWGVGASLVMESVPVRWRGLLSGFLADGLHLRVFPGGGGLLGCSRSGAGAPCSLWAACPHC